MTVSFAPRVATCTWRENQDPTWAGEALEDMLNNDSIYPPAVFTSLIEHLWKSWRNGDIREEEVNTELQLIITWLNEITAKKPRSDFWRKYF